jgi:hypothetical protein
MNIPQFFFSFVIETKKTIVFEYFMPSKFSKG